jgi:hypothetical protein
MGALHARITNRFCARTNHSVMKTLLPSRDDVIWSTTQNRTIGHVGDSVSGDYVGRRTCLL